MTAAGAPIDSGTIVIRRGVIDAVGASVAVPADAAVIDGTGLTVYPGLIDLGNTRAADQPAPQMPQNLRTIGRGRALEARADSEAAGARRRCGESGRCGADASSRRRGSRPCWRCRRGDVISGQSALVNVAAPPDDPQIGNIVGRAPRPDRREIAGCAARVDSRTGRARAATRIRSR